jgi:non-ribosomal peptide synthetase component E (peptide arylation enzyme)
MQTIYDLIRLAADRTPDRVALVDDKSTRHLTYRELQIEVDSIAGGMLHAGVKPGRPVLTALPNLFEHCLAVLALQRLGSSWHWQIRACRPPSRPNWPSWSMPRP